MTTSPADELRTAAQTLRERAASATPGPWRREDDQRRLERFVSSENGTLDINFGYLGNNNQADAEYVALMDPGVGAALADWLDTVTQYAELYANLTLTSTGAPPDEASYDQGTRHALAVARQINGGAP
ncbi:hypothetical protein ACFVTT_34140 [Streptomyces niveus]|uniref:hypothetical protein n=1 Tax=Streptomyces niveus TaxID=193462 RepID=UPI003436E8BC